MAINVTKWVNKFKKKKQKNEERDNPDFEAAFDSE